jgi:hypothetical protein
MQEILLAVNIRLPKVAPRGAGMRRGRTTLMRLAVVALLAGSIVAVASPPAHATLTPRECRTILTGDGLRRMDVCARGYVNGPPADQTRGVVEMHTYRKSGSGWVDSTSQSITLNGAYVHCCTDNRYVAAWGNEYNNNGSCRIDGPSGTIGCLVKNDYRVAYYSAKISAPGFNSYQTEVFKVSWRDDRGIPHYKDFGDTVDGSLSSPRWFG